MGNTVRWIGSNGNIETEILVKTEAFFNIKFPMDYTECVIQNDGGYPKPNRFKLNGNEEIFNNLLSFDEEDESGIINTYKAVEDGLLAQVVPFAEDPFGNLLCFDYRNSHEPVIVFWDHEKAFNNKDMAVTSVCGSFTKLLSLIHESEEE